jgi:predicted transcriptional regulator of viral defense system
MPKTDIRDTVMRDLVLQRPLFTSQEAVRVSGGAPASVSRALRHMADAHLLTRLTRGVWANRAHPLFSPYLVIGAWAEAWNEPVYVTSVSALHLHGMLSQIPREIHLATARQRPSLQTPVGAFAFHRLPAALLTGTEPGDEWGRYERATAEKALFDTVYLSCYRGRKWRHLPEIELPPSWSWEAWTPWIHAINYAPVLGAMEAARERLRHELRVG